MVTPDTPLPEVAAHLPRESARSLMELPNHVQVAVLHSLRGMIAGWESTGVTLDPIQFEGVTAAVVEQLVEATLDHCAIIARQSHVIDEQIHALEQAQLIALLAHQQNHNSKKRKGRGSR